MSQPRVAILLPCYNEGVAIGSVVRQCKKILPHAAIYVYDNNSSDHTAQEARLAGAYVRYEVIQGKGAVVRRMFTDIEADVYVMCDGDGTYDMKALPIHIQRMIQEPCDMVIGVRQPNHPNAFRRGHCWGNRWLTRLAHLLFGYPLHDLLSGYRIMSRRFVKSFIGQTQGFEIETELTLHAITLGVRIVQAHVLYGTRMQGSVSKLSTVFDGFKILKTILKFWVQRHPLISFTPLSVLCLCIGSWSFAYQETPSRLFSLISLLSYLGGFVFLGLGCMLWWVHILTTSLKHLTFSGGSTTPQDKRDAA